MEESTSVLVMHCACKPVSRTLAMHSGCIYILLNGGRDTTLCRQIERTLQLSFSFCLLYNLQAMITCCYSAAKFQSSDSISHTQTLPEEYTT